MAINFTPLSAYIDLKGAAQRRAEDRKEAFGNLGATVGLISGLIGKKRYENDTKKFFESLGDGEIKAGEEELKDIDAQIAEIEQQIAELEGGV